MPRYPEKYDSLCFLFDHLNKMVEDEIPRDIHIVMEEEGTPIKDRMKVLQDGIDLLSMVLVKRSNA